MKKITISIALVFLCIILNGQTKRINKFINDAVIKTESYIDKSASDRVSKNTGIPITVLMLPSFESFDLEKLVFRLLLADNEDIKITRVWTKSDDKDLEKFTMILNVDNHGVMITYIEGSILISDHGLINK